MDTVTESRLAIAMAQQGGIGVIHKNLSIEEQASEVDRVKRSESGMIVNPITLSPANRIFEALELMKKYRISGVPITEDGSKEGRLVGILTNRDLRFETNLDRPIADIMTREPLFTVPVGTTLEQAREILHRHKVEKLLVVDDRLHAEGADHRQGHPEGDQVSRTRARTALGRLRVRRRDRRRQGRDGARRSARRRQRRRARRSTRRTATRRACSTWCAASGGSSPTSISIAGNVATGEATEALIDLGVDAVKVGIGAGSICTTRVVAGIGVPMITAVADCARAAAPHKVPIIADGGIRYSGDITKAMAVGASAVMIGSLFAGTDESPGEMILFRAAASRNTAAWARSARCAAAAATATSRTSSISTPTPRQARSWCPEGIEGRVAHKGSVAAMIHQLVGGLRAGMGYCGCPDIPSLQRDAKMIRVTPRRASRRPRPRRHHHQGSAELPVE